MKEKNYCNGNPISVWINSSPSIFHLLTPFSQKMLITITIISQFTSEGDNVRIIMTLKGSTQQVTYSPNNMLRLINFKFKLHKLTLYGLWVVNIVMYRPVARQKLRNKEGVNSRCYAMILRWNIILDPILGNGSVNTFPLQRLRM
jgi:hypothetical protein